MNSRFSEKIEDALFFSFDLGPSNEYNDSMEDITHWDLIASYPFLQTQNENTSLNLRGLGSARTKRFLKHHIKSNFLSIVIMQETLLHKDKVLEILLRIYPSRLGFTSSSLGNLSDLTTI